MLECETSSFTATCRPFNYAFKKIPVIGQPVLSGFRPKLLRIVRKMQGQTFLLFPNRAEQTATPLLRIGCGDAPPRKCKAQAQAALHVLGLPPAFNLSHGRSG